MDYRTDTLHSTPLRLAVSFVHSSHKNIPLKKIIITILVKLLLDLVQMYCRIFSFSFYFYDLRDYYHCWPADGAKFIAFDEALSMGLVLKCRIEHSLSLVSLSSPFLCSLLQQYTKDVMV